MVAHLEANPEARAVVNFAPVLLEQIDDYAKQIRAYLETSRVIQDPLLAALAEPVLISDEEQRVSLVKACLRANEERLIKRFPAYEMLVEFAKWTIKHPASQTYISDQFLIDLLVWFHLAWMGETVRRTDRRIRRLIEKAHNYNLQDRHDLVSVIGELLQGLIGRYRKLAETGRIELSMSPYAHPIMPLLQDIGSASEAMPDVQLPALETYPQGEDRVRWHIEQGMACFERYFGFKPDGCWPSEGGISDATLGLLAEAGMRWTASGENVLRNSLKRHHVPGLTDENGWLHSGYQYGNNGPACFFRDDGLSDLIGFTYADWHADDAVANLINHLENIADICKDEQGTIVPIILDGENAWEYYPKNGYYFLSALYKSLAKHPALELTTFSKCLDDNIPLRPLPRIVAGSWVYGTFSTWIGDHDKNRGWDMLGEAKHVYDKVMASPRLNNEQRDRAARQLAICEGSDWFWWFGDYNPEESVSNFEHLYRQHLSNLYQFLGAEPPAYLSESFTHGSGTPAMGGTMRHGQQSE